MRIFGAVEIAGIKWCGKTWSARQHGASITYVDRDNNLQIAHADPSLMILGGKPHIIDEWQLAPAIWDEVCHQVGDNSNQKGQWILTGSSTPLFDELPNHSGSGRIGRIKRHPMTLAESGLSEQTVSLQGLFNHEFTPTQQDLSTEQLFDAVCRGGWPETQGMPVEDVQTRVSRSNRWNWQVCVPQGRWRIRYPYRHVGRVVDCTALNCCNYCQRAIFW